MHASVVILKSESRPVIDEFDSWSNGDSVAFMTVSCVQDPQEETVEQASQT